MKAKKAKKDPTQAPIKEFLSDSHAAVAAGEAAERDSWEAALEAAYKDAGERALADLLARSWPNNKIAAPLGPEDVERAIKAAFREVKGPNDLWDLMEDWWPVRLLRHSLNNPDHYKRRLYYLLSRLEVAPPDGVLTPWPGKRGRTPNPIAEMNRANWLKDGKPPLDAEYCDRLAQLSYPGEFARTKPYSLRRKRLRDRVAKHVRSINK